MPTEETAAPGASPLTQVRVHGVTGHGQSSRRCGEGASFAFGVAAMGDYVNNSAWGYGYGPMISEWEDELSEFLGSDWTALGDTAGTSYLKWDNADGTNVTTWGYFDVYGFGEGNLIDFAAGTTAGVRDAATPADGYYNNSTVYVLTFSAG